MNLNLYLISLRFPGGQMINYKVVAATRAAAETKAIELAKLPPATEPHTVQLACEGIDAIVTSTIDAIVTTA